MASGHRTLRDVISAQARRFTRRPFLEFQGRQFSFAEVDDRTDRVATALSRLGLRAGDRLALLLPNRPELVFFLWGATKIGAVPVSLNPDAATEEIRAALARVTPRAVVTELPHAVLRSSLPQDTHWVAVDDASFHEEPFRGLERGASVLGFWPDLDGRAPAVVAFAGGQGQPGEPVLLSHGNLLEAAAQLVRPFRMDETDRFVCLLPLSAVFSQVFLILTPWIAGATVVLADSARPEAAEWLGSDGISVTACTPHLFEKLLDARSPKVPALRLGVCPTGAVGEKILREFERRYDAIAVEAYGVPEATCLTCANPYTGLRKPGSVGLPLPGQQCRIVDAAGAEVAAGATGEILIRGPNVMSGYLDDAGATSGALRGGWLHTGDFGRCDSDGYYYLSDGSASRLSALMP